MLKQRNEQIQAAMRGLDLLICVAAFFAAYSLRGTVFYSFARYESLGTTESLTWLLVTSLGLHLVLYPLNRFYTSLRMKSFKDIIFMVLRAALAEFFVLGALVFLFQAKTTSRYFFGLFLGLNYGLILAEKLGARVFLSSIRRRGFNYRQVLVIGTGGNAVRLIQSLRKNAHWGYVPCGVLVPGSATVGAVENVPVWGALSDLEVLVRQKTIDEIIFALDRIDAGEVSEQMALCERLGIPTRFSLGLFDLPQSKIMFSHMDQIPLLTFYTTLRTPFEAIVKRLMDIIISVVGLSLTAILFPWIALRIQMQSPGPTLFKQRRVGENGRVFSCYKFRTMVVDAEAKKAELQAQNKMAGPLFKLDQDPRVFPFGSFLRKSSLDELPQFFNIFRGDMSVVGTRPPTPDEVKQYESHYRRRLSIRPGLTGLWQVSGRNEIRDFEDVLKLDLNYIDNWSFWFDVKIVAKTIWTAFTKKGAV
jgi:exopolysaccharide biosynthesis polyprenyl glycosylphosphotransferase